MTTLTYCKALPTPIDELNALGFTQLEMFLASYAPIYHSAVCKTVNFMLSGNNFNRSQWRTHLQDNYSISARHANGVISVASGEIESAKSSRILHIKTLENPAKSCEKWLLKAEVKLKNARKFYAVKNLDRSKKVCALPLSCALKSRQTNWQSLRWQTHNKKRKLQRFQQKIAALRTAPLQVSVRKHQALVVGCKNDPYGGRLCQWDGNKLRFRVPACLESKFGKYVESKIGDFSHNINRLLVKEAKIWHFYRKKGKWLTAVSFTPPPVKRVSGLADCGCISISLNPGSIGGTYNDKKGNLKARDRLRLQTGVANDRQQTQIFRDDLQMAALAITYQCQIVCEELDCSVKKQQLRQREKNNVWMLSGWDDSQFFKLLNSILANQGIELITVNPAYSSIMGLVKYLKMYGLGSDEAASLVIARRGMGLSEKIPGSLTALVEVNSAKHVWSLWHQLNKKIERSGIVANRHSYYAISNWDCLANLNTHDWEKRKGKH